MTDRYESRATTHADNCWSWGPAHYGCAVREIERLRAEVDQLSEALRRWWEAHRPVGWTEDQHRSCPHVNLATNAEKALADSMLKTREASND